MCWRTCWRIGLLFHRHAHDLHLNQYCGLNLLNSSVLHHTVHWVIKDGNYLMISLWISYVTECGAVRKNGGCSVPFWLCCQHNSINLGQLPWSLELWRVVGNERWQISHVCGTSKLCELVRMCLDQWCQLFACLSVFGENLLKSRPIAMVTRTVDGGGHWKMTNISSIWY